MLPVSIKDTAKGNDAHFVSSKGDYPFAAYNPNKWLQRRTSQMAQLDGGFVITVTVNGNTALHAGEIVELELPSSAMQKSVEKETVDRFFRGPFMIRNLQHRFDVIERTHKIIMTLVKDCVEKKLEGTTNNIVPVVNSRGINYDQPEDFYNTRQSARQI